MTALGSTQGAIGMPPFLTKLVPARRRACLAFAGALFLPDPAFASGGAPVVDDSEVETPGLCHVETWATGYDPGGGLLNLGPGCTFRSLPAVEFGAALQHSWDDGDARTLAGPAVKWALRPVDRRFGLAVAVSAAMDLETGRVESAAAVVPVTFDVAEGLRLNLNAAYHWSRTGDRHSVSGGVQLDYRASPTISLMAEAFGRRFDEAGWQAGVRWTPRSWIDVDLLGGRRVDGNPRTAFTFGITLRR